MAGELEIVPTAMTEVINESGDGINPLWAPWAVEYDRLGNLYVAGAGSDNVFRVGKDGTIRQIIGPRGDGAHSLDSPIALATDSSGNVFVAGYQSHNVFRVSASGRVEQVIGPEGDGISALEFPFSLAVDPDGVVYVSGFFSNNVFAIAPGGSVEEVIDESGDGDTEFVIPTSMLVNRQGGLIVAASGTLFRLEPDLTVTTVFEASQERSLGFPYRIRSDGPGSVVAISDMNGLGDVRLLRNAADGNVKTILDVGAAYSQPFGPSNGFGSYVVGTDFLRRPDGSLLIAAHKIEAVPSGWPDFRTFFTGTLLELLPDGTVRKLIQDDGSVPRRQPYNLAVAPDGRVAFSDAQQNAVLLLGTPTSYPVPSGSRAATVVLVLMLLITGLCIMLTRRAESLSTADKLLENIGNKSH